MNERPTSTLLGGVRSAIAVRVVDLFNDRARGERPVQRRPDGLFGPRSVAWRVHGDVTGMMVGGIAGLLLQMLHPAVLAGVWDHSNFRADMQGRLRRTARFMATTTYGSRDEAAAVIARVRAIHERVSGVLPDGTPYAAHDPAALAWVHLAGASSFLGGWMRYAEPFMPRAAQDRYYAETATVAELLGADPVPRSTADAARLFAAMRPLLRADARSREVARIVLTQRPAEPAAGPLLALTLQAGVDLLPDWARDMHGLPMSPLGRPLLRAGTLGLAQTIRWAFRGSAARGYPRAQGA